MRLRPLRRRPSAPSSVPATAHALGRGGSGPYASAAVQAAPPIALAAPATPRACSLAAAAAPRAPPRPATGAHHPALAAALATSHEPHRLANAV